MTGRYLAEMLTPAIVAEEKRYHGGTFRLPARGGADALGEDEMAFLARRDSFYLATVTADGWPYVQHRGGPRGFLKVVDAGTLAFADLRGNRQLITTGNLVDEARVALIAVDYPARRRLKVMGRAEALDAREHPALADAVAPPELRRRVERVVRIAVVAYDWNCAAYITPRYTEEELREADLFGGR
ncbi:MAG: pyridoxamine 5'-phosphate oxidase family protein [Myxococcales bacterium]|nr:pyridoxamine 5'-phosphate oxidase family protein [Myxococcales bacterium]